MVNGMFEASLCSSTSSRAGKAVEGEGEKEGKEGRRAAGLVWFASDVRQNHDHDNDDDDDDNGHHRSLDGSVENRNDSRVKLVYAA